MGPPPGQRGDSACTKGCRALAHPQPRAPSTYYSEHPALSTSSHPSNRCQFCDCHGDSTSVPGTLHLASDSRNSQVPWSLPQAQAGQPGSVIARHSRGYPASCLDSPGGHSTATSRKSCPKLWQGFQCPCPPWLCACIYMPGPMPPGWSWQALNELFLTLWPQFLHLPGKEVDWSLGLPNVRGP